MTHEERAKELFVEGYNCCQAVVLSYAEELGLPTETLAKLSSSFGGGIGRLREVCGAVSGMAMVLGFLEGYDDPKAIKDKAEHYKLIQKLAGEFKNVNHSIICRELMDGVPQNDSDPQPAERTKKYYEVRPCKQLVGSASAILEKYFAEKSK